MSTNKAMSQWPVAASFTASAAQTMSGEGRLERDGHRRRQPRALQDRRVDRLPKRPHSKAKCRRPARSLSSSEL